MSISYAEPALRPVATPGAATAEPATIRHPSLWLGVFLLVGLVLRLWYLLNPNCPFQIDEFGPVFAVAERAAQPGFLPTTEAPLVAVKSLQNVRERSVFPYGIVNPVPLYHYILFGVVKVLPIADWSLRLPSLLAGLACIVAVYYLCRQLMGVEVALVAAALTAVEPMQIGVSFVARPYALGNLACVLSFLALLGILDARRPWGAALAAVGYGGAVAFLTYMNPILLLVGVAHVALVVHARLTRGPGITGRLLWWLAGCGLAVLFLWPELGYFAAMRQFRLANHEYLGMMESTRLLGVLMHNSTFFVALVVVSVAGYLVGELLNPQTSAESANGENGIEPFATTVEDGNGSAPSGFDQIEAAGETRGGGSLPLPPENSQFIWLGRCWFFLPQLVAMLLVYTGGQFVFVSRYLSYTTIGGVILLAYWATRDRSKEVRLGVSILTVGAVFLWSFMTVSQGFGLYAPPFARRIVEQLDMLADEGRFKDGDVLLVRSPFIEGDLLPDRVPTATHATLHAAVLSPFTTLYVPKTPKPYILLSMSQFYNDKLRTITGEHYDPQPYYTDNLAAEVRKHERFWVSSLIYDRPGFISGFLPWLANAVGWDLKVARNRLEPERYFDVPTDIDPNDFVAGLSDSLSDDFTFLILARRKQPKGIFTLGALSLATMPNSWITVPVWLGSGYRSPRLTQRPEEDFGFGDDILELERVANERSGL